MTYKNIVNSVDYLCPLCDDILDYIPKTPEDVDYWECNCGHKVRDISDCEEYVDYEERFCPPGN